MDDIDYHAIALVPGETCDVDAVVASLLKAGYRAESAESDSAVGFRVIEEDGWGIVAWIEDSEESLDVISSLSEDPPDGVTAEQIQACKLTLSIWSDDDSDFMNAHVFEEFIQCLKESCGYFIYDNRQGLWR